MLNGFMWQNRLNFIPKVEKLKGYLSSWVSFLSSQYESKSAVVPNWFSTFPILFFSANFVLFLICLWPISFFPLMTTVIGNSVLWSDHLVTSGYGLMVYRDLVFVEREVTESCLLVFVVYSSIMRSNQIKSLCWEGEQLLNSQTGELLFLVFS